MTNLRKIMAVILAITMIMSLAVSVSADDYSIVVNTPDGANNDGEIYYAYKIFDAEASGSTYIYTLSSKSFFYNTIYYLSDVYSNTGAVVSTASSTAYFKLTATDSTNATYIVEVLDVATGSDSYLASEVVSALKTQVDTDTSHSYATAQGVADNGSATISITGNTPGYYFVTTTVGSAVAVGGTYPTTATLNDKNENPSVDKTVYDEAGQTYDTNSKENNAQIGDDVYFQVKITNINDATNLVMHDLAEAGLDIYIDSIVIKLYSGTDAGTESTLQTNDGDYSVEDSGVYYMVGKLTAFGDTTYYTYDATSNPPYTVVTGVATPDPDTDYYVLGDFDIIFDLTTSAYNYVDEDSYMIVSYKATVTSDAEVYDESNDNQTYVTYGNSSYTAKSTTMTYVYEVEAYKYYNDAYAGVTALENVGFKLYYLDGSNTPTYVDVTYDDDLDSPTHGYWVVNGTTDTDPDNVTQITTASDGTFKIAGLDADETYYLKETDTPQGFNPLTADIMFKINSTTKTLVDYGTSSISDNEGQSNIRILNSQGANMPETGGIGTTIFYVVGGILVVGAVVLLITKKRLGNKED